MAQRCLGHVPSSHPVIAIEERLSRSLIRSGVTDLHVHVGATVPFDVVFGLVIDRAARELITLEGSSSFLDSSGASVSPSHAIATATFVALALNVYKRRDTMDFVAACASIFTPSFAAAVVAGQTWAFLAEADPIAIVDAPRYNAPRRLWVGEDDPEQLVDTESDDLFGSLVRLKAEWLAMARIDPLCAPAVEELLRCETVLYQALTQGPHGGLLEFLLRSSRLKVLREFAAPKRVVVDHGLRHLARGVKLLHAELRTAEDGPGGHDTVSRAMAESLDQQFQGYADYIRHSAGENSPCVSWPICLIKPPSDLARCLPHNLDGRRLDSSVTGTDGPVRFCFTRLWTVVGVATQQLLADPYGRKLCPGFDVAGYEPSLPSWCFALMFRESLRLLSMRHSQLGEAPVSFRVHAGECYRSPLEGLRRVDEAVSYVTPDGSRPRIGHALVLSAPNWDVAQLSAQPWDEALDDLVWGWRWLESGVTREEHALADAFAAAICEFGAQRYSDVHSTTRMPEDYWRAYIARFSPEHARTLGLVRDSLCEGEDDAWPQLATSVTVDWPQRPRENLISLYLTDAELDCAVGTPIVDQSKLRRAYELIQPRIVSRMRDRAAVIEACPTSNLVIAGVQGYAQHPLLALLQQQVAVTLNTDDPGLFGTTIRDEYALMAPALTRDFPDANARFQKLDEIRTQGQELVDSDHDATTALEATEGTRARWRAAGLLPPDPGVATDA